MAKQQRRSKRTKTGSIYRKDRKKKVREIGAEPTHTRVGTLKKKVKKVTGGNPKQVLLNVNSVNLYDPKTKKYSKQKIKTVLENSANRNFVRRAILTKGTVIETESGQARITSRPGQEGSVNAILIGNKK